MTVNSPAHYLKHLSPLLLICIALSFVGSVFAEPRFTTDYEADEEDLRQIIAEAQRLELDTSAAITAISGEIHHEGRSPSHKMIKLTFAPYERDPSYNRHWRMRCDYDFLTEEPKWSCEKIGITRLLVLSDPARMISAAHANDTDINILKDILDYAMLNLYKGKDLVHSMRVTPGGQFVVYFAEKNVQCKTEMLMYWGRNIYESIVRAQMKRKSFYCGPLESYD